MRTLVAFLFLCSTAFAQGLNLDSVAISRGAGAEVNATITVNGVADHKTDIEYSPGKNNNNEPADAYMSTVGLNAATAVQSHTKTVEGKLVTCLCSAVGQHMALNRSVMAGWDYDLYLDTNYLFNNNGVVCLGSAAAGSVAIQKWEIDDPAAQQNVKATADVNIRFIWDWSRRTPQVGNGGNLQIIQGARFGKSGAQSTNIIVVWDVINDRVVVIGSYYKPDGTFVDLGKNPLIFNAANNKIDVNHTITVGQNMTKNDDVTATTYVNDGNPLTSVSWKGKQLIAQTTDQGLSGIDKADERGSGGMLIHNIKVENR